jgi:carbon-monoxide dehydrogenase medium subunit
MMSDPGTGTGGRPQYLRPESLDELFGILRTHPDARVLAGGTDLVVRLRKRVELPRVIVDLKRVESLRRDVRQTGDVVRIGARAVITDIVDNTLLRERFPALIEAALVVGSVQIRNRATITGNICNASPAADTSPPLLAYGALVNVVGSTGSRTVPLDHFFTGPGKTVLGRGEIVDSIDLPLPKERSGSAFGRLTRRHGVDLAIVSLACVVRESGDVRYAFGAVGPRPFVVITSLRRDETQPGYGWQALRDAALQDVLKHARPISDLRASEEYRLAMLPVLARRALKTALERLNESSGSA